MYNGAVLKTNYSKKKKKITGELVVRPDNYKRKYYYLYTKLKYLWYYSFENYKLLQAYVYLNIYIYKQWK